MPTHAPRRSKRSVRTVARGSTRRSARRSPGGPEPMPWWRRCSRRSRTMRRMRYSTSATR
jgi:hypothetical protein